MLRLSLRREERSSGSRREVRREEAREEDNWLDQTSSSASDMSCSDAWSIKKRDKEIIRLMNGLSPS